MVLGVQLLGLGFGVFMMYYTFLHFKRKEFTPAEFGVWFCLWIALLVASLFPQWLDLITMKLDFKRTFDLLVVGGFVVLSWLFFSTYTKLKLVQDKLERLVKELAKK